MRQIRGLSPCEAASKINVGNAPSGREGLPPKPTFPNRPPANFAIGNAYTN
jgi:hypothetical protein